MCRRRRTQGARAILLLTLVALSISVSQVYGAAAAAPRAAQLVGAVGSQFFVGVSAEQNRAVAFVTDGKTVTAWLAGPVEGGRASLRDRQGAATLTGQLSSAAATGIFRLPNGTEQRFTLAAARGSAGLFALRKLSAVGSATTLETAMWIRLNDGRARGVRRLDRASGASFLGSSVIPRAATRVTPEALLPHCRKPARSSEVLLGCGFPRSGVSAANLMRTRVLKAPRNSGLTSTQARALATRAYVRMQDDLRKLGLRTPSAELRRAADGWAARLRESSRVLSQAELLRVALLSGNLASVSTRLDTLETTLESSPFAMPQTMRRALESLRNALPAVPRPPPRPMGAAEPNPLELDGDDFALTETRSSNGENVGLYDTVEVLHPTPSANAVVLQARVKADFHSEGSLVKSAIARFEVPPGIDQVEIELAGSVASDTELPCMLWGFVHVPGMNFASASALLNIERVTPTGEITVAGMSHLDWDTLPPTPPWCIPVPDPPALQADWPRFLRFEPPAGGGTYQLHLHASASAETVGFATASANIYLAINLATIRFRR